MINGNAGRLFYYIVQGTKLNNRVLLYSILFTTAAGFNGMIFYRSLVMDTIEIVIETPRGSVEKYSFDKERKVFKLKKILPTGMSFPYDFGFIPDTKGEDGDPLDVVLLSEFKSFPGCYMDCRIIGVLICEQGEDGKTIRNDRYVAVPALSTMFRDFKSVKELPEDKLDELEQFFINYNRIRGKKFKLLKLGSAEKAHKMLRKQLRNAHSH